MAEVDARNKHYTKIVLKGDSPVKTHFLIILSQSKVDQDWMKK